jgi:hypothetical protein
MHAPLTRRAGILSDERGLHLYPLLKFLLKELGPEYLAWDSIALRLELEERWGQPGEVTWQRIQSGRIMVGHDGFWIDPQIFENCALALAGEIPVFSHMQPLEAESVAVAFHTAGMISGRDWSGDVLGYALSCCLHDGTWYFEPGGVLAPLREMGKEYEQSFRLTRPHNAVAEYLRDRRKDFSDPQSEAQVQFNHVRSVERTLDAYRQALSAQLQELKL